MFLNAVVFDPTPLSDWHNPDGAFYQVNSDVEAIIRACQQRSCGAAAVRQHTVATSSTTHHDHHPDSCETGYTALRYMTRRVIWHA